MSRPPSVSLHSGLPGISIGAERKGALILTGLAVLLIIVKAVTRDGANRTELYHRFIMFLLVDPINGCH